MKELQGVERLVIEDSLEISGKRKALKISDICGEPVGIGYDTSGHLQYLTRKGFELLALPSSSAHHGDVGLRMINIFHHLFRENERTASLEIMGDEDVHVYDSSLLRLRQNNFIWVEVVHASALFVSTYKALTDKQKALTQEISFESLRALLLPDGIYSVGREDTMAKVSESVEQDVLKISGMLAGINDAVKHVASDLEFKFEDAFEEYA